MKRILFLTLFLLGLAGSASAQLMLQNATSPILTITNKYAIGTSSPLVGTGGLDISAGGIGLVVGADTDLNTRTNSTAKAMHFGAPHYTNSEEPIAALSVISNPASSHLHIGSSTLMNTPTNIFFWTAGNTITLGGTSRGEINSTGNWTIGPGTADGTVGLNPSLDIQSGWISLLVGADNTAATRTNATNKISRIASYHYTNSEEPVGLIEGQSTTSTNIVSIGGNSGLLNAATQIDFWTAANNTTTSGTQRLTIDSSGNLNLAGGAYQYGGVSGVTGTCDTPTFSGGIATTCGGSGGSVDGNYYVTGNFTTANNTNFQAITGLAWTFPVTTALNVPFSCKIIYSQATAAVSDSLGIQDVTVAPTNAAILGSAETALGTTAYGDLTAFSSTTATAVVTFTPSATATTFNAYLDGFIEQPSNASSSAFQIQIKTTTGADAITVYRGSYCKVG